MKKLTTAVLSAAFVLFAGVALASDGFIYCAPQALTPPTIDGDPDDWPSDDVLPWEPINHWCEGSGLCENGGRNDPPNSPEDFTAEFKMMWGYVGSTGDVPVLYILVRWIDDEFHFCMPEEGGTWDNTDVFQFWLSETCVTQELTWGQVQEGGISVFRQSNVFLGEDSGLRVWAPGISDYFVDPNMPYSIAEFSQVSATEAYIEEQWQLYYRYPDQYLEIVPGETTIPLGISGANDYDSYDGSFTYMTWGLSNRDPAWGWPERVATMLSDVVLMGPTTAEERLVTFRNVTDEAGVGHPGKGQNCAWGDYDNDGFLDLYVTNVGGPNVLYRNMLGERASNTPWFRDVTREAGVGETKTATGLPSVTSTGTAIWTSMCRMPAAMIGSITTTETARLRASLPLFAVWRPVTVERLSLGIMTGIIGSTFSL